MIRLAYRFGNPRTNEYEGCHNCATALDENSTCEKSERTNEGTAPSGELEEYRSIGQLGSILLRANNGDIAALGSSQRVSAAACALKIVVASHAVNNSVDRASAQRRSDVEVGASIVEEDYVGAALLNESPIRGAGVKNIRLSHWKRTRSESACLHIPITHAPMFLAICTATCPTPPLAPMMTTVEPGVTCALRMHSEAVRVTTPAAHAGFKCFEQDSLTTLVSGTTQK